MNKLLQQIPLRLPLGRLVATPGALALLELHSVPFMTLVWRHESGDWGDLCADDKQSNWDDLVNGCRILSAYIVAPGEKVWIITEWDRSVTTILLPSEY
jgi:hypothetical protein